jgi:hypothetical protein
MRVAMRSDKTQDSYGAFVAFACTLNLVKSVHRGERTRGAVARGEAALHQRCVRLQKLAL